MIEIMPMILLDAIAKLTRRTRALSVGDTLFRAGDPVRSLFVVRAGDVRLMRNLTHGTSLILQRASPGSILAEASLYSRRYHCDAIAMELSSVSVTPRAAIEGALRNDPQLADAWAQHLAESLQRARAGAEILSLRRVPERIDAWLALNGGRLPPKGRWRHLASEIAVTPEALYRALAVRRGARP